MISDHLIAEARRVSEGSQIDAAEKQPADAAALRAFVDYTSGRWTAVLTGEMELQRDILAARVRALADVLDTITPRVVALIQEAWDDELDAADSMDTSPHKEAHEYRRAAEALCSLLTPEQRKEVDALMD